jgi:hypothetical protein
MDAETRTRHLPTSQRAVKRNAETEIGQRQPQANLSFFPKLGYLLRLTLSAEGVVLDCIHALGCQKACAADRAGKL